MRILNLTQYIGTPEQGVIEPVDKQKIVDLLTFTELPTKDIIESKALALAEIAVQHECEFAMIGGAPYLMAPLEVILLLKGVKSLFSFSERFTLDEKLPDGSVIKQSTFKHTGWVQGAMEIE